MSKRLNTMATLLLWLMHLSIASTGDAQTRGKAQKTENLLLAQASEAYAKADYAKSLGYLKDLFEQAVAAERDSFNSHFLMGRCLDKQDKFDEAKYHFKIAISNGYDHEDIESASLKPARKEVELYREAILRYDEDDFSGSVRILEQLLNRNLYKKDRLEPLLLLGRNEIRLRNEIKAREHFRQVIKIDKKYNPDPGIFKYDDELDFFLATKQHGSSGGIVSFIKKNWYIVVGAAAAVAVVSGLRK